MMVDKIYCINLDRRPDRWTDVQAQFQKHQLQVERFPAVDGRDFIKEYASDPYNAGCTLSHYFIIERAFILGLKSIMVFEDDAELHPDFSRILDLAMKDLPDDADVLYFGAAHREKPKKYTNNLFRVIRSLTTHGYIMRSSIFPYMMSALKELDQPVDCIFHKLQKEHNSCYVTEPPIAWQSKSFSDIQGRVMEYPWIKSNKQ